MYQSYFNLNNSWVQKKKRFFFVMSTKMSTLSAN